MPRPETFLRHIGASKTQRSYRRMLGAVCLTAAAVSLAISRAQSADSVPADGGSATADDSSDLDSKQLAEEARVALQIGDYDKAMTLLKAAIASNPKDMGANYNPWSFKIQESDFVEHGQTQLECMLRDRPLMNTNLHPFDEIPMWAALKYAEKVQEARILWDPSELSPLNTSHYAEHEIPGNGYDGRIRVRNARINPNLTGADAKREQLATFERLWCSAVFELHNIESAKDFLQVYQQAKDGKLDRDAFVKAMFFIELKNCQRTRKWYVEVFLPHAKRYNLRTDPDWWYCSLWNSPDFLFSQYTDKTSYPWEPYSTYFSQIESEAAATPTSN